MAKLPDFEEKSKIAEQLCRNNKAVIAAQEEIFKHLAGSVQKIQALVNDSDPSVALRAAKEHLTLAGLYVENINHSGKLEFVPLQISREVRDET